MKLGKRWIKLSLLQDQKSMQNFPSELNWFQFVSKISFHCNFYCEIIFKFFCFHSRNVMRKCQHFVLLIIIFISQGLYDLDLHDLHVHSPFLFVSRLQHSHIQVINVKDYNPCLTFLKQIWRAHVVVKNIKIVSREIRREYSFLKKF